MTDVPGPSPAEARFARAARTYLAYGIVYWLGGLALVLAGRGPRGTARGAGAWLLVGAVLVVVIPWLLHRERRWFDRWILSRRDFARLLTVLVVLRAVEVGRLAAGPAAAPVRVLGLAIPFAAGAWVFCLLTIVTAMVLARAAWTSRPRPGP